MFRVEDHLTKVTIFEGSWASYIKSLFIITWLPAHFICLYLLSSFTVAILAYIIARCFPRQFRGPPEKTGIANCGNYLY